jgi:hypothetical protein
VDSCQEHVLPSDAVLPSLRGSHFALAFVLFANSIACGPTNRFLQGTAVVVSNIKAPLGVVIPRRLWSTAVNPAMPYKVIESLQEEASDGEEISTAEHAALGRKLAEFGETLDPLPADRPQPRLVIAVSGGGSRAAMLAAHAMAVFELSYERAFRQRQSKGEFQGVAAPTPLIELIDAFSTVSGGSLYAFQVALWFKECKDRKHFGLLWDTKIEQDDPYCDCHQAFRTILRRAAEWRDGIQNVGARAGLTFLMLPPTPFYTIIGNRSFTDLMASVMQPGLGDSLRIMAPTISLGDLPPTPRFFFNAAEATSGTSFVLTRNVINLPAPMAADGLASIDREPSPERGTAAGLRPLIHSLTLEDIGSSPAQFPLAVAAVASAAFPIGFEPIRIRRFRANPAKQTMLPDSPIALVDGGVFDNSGLTTAVDFLDYSRRRDGAKRACPLLVSINAEVAVPDPQQLTLPRVSSDWEDDLPVARRSPVASLFSAIDSLEFIHLLNKRRSEHEARDRLLKAPAMLGDSCGAVPFLPVNLTDLSSASVYGVRGADPLFQEVARIPTELVLTDEQSSTLAAAARAIRWAPRDHFAGESAANVSRMEGGERGAQRNSLAHQFADRMLIGAGAAGPCQVPPQCAGPPPGQYVPR